MKTGNISVQSENIFPIIKKFLYSDQEIFLRELVSNAVDATNKLKTLASKGEFKGSLGDLTINIKVDKENKTLTISDQGIGMSEEEVVKYLNQMAFSSAQEFLEKHQDSEAIIGHFGLGFYSAFMVADKVEVITKSYREKGDAAVKWTCEGEPNYTLEDTIREHRGSDIILHINDDAMEYLEDARIESLLKKYCSFLPIPIQFGTKEHVEFEGEGDDEKEIKTQVPNVINDTDPIWKKKPADLTDEDYKAFYNKLYPFSQPPLFWIHMNIDFPFNLTGILYFPKLGNQLELQKNKIQLYSNQVYVTDDVSAIVPEFLTLLHGVIDSPDIPLNVSRSYLQSDHNVKKITSHITKKVADKLKSINKNDRKEFEEKWDEISVFVKYGMLSDEKFDERLRPIALLKNVKDEYYTISEYREKVKATQTDKHDRTIFIYAQDKDAQGAYVTSAQEAGYDVLLTDLVIDNHFMQHLETKEDKLTFVRVDSETTDHLVQTDETKESVLSEKEQEKVKSLFESQLEAEKNKLQFKALSPDAMPVQITKPEFMRRFSEMQKLQGMGADMGMDMEMYNIVVNTNHPLIADKLIKMRSEEKKSEFIQYLFDIARLNQGMLKGPDMNTFVKRSLEFVG
jgi:molecular chaperone HtpG